MEVLLLDYPMSVLHHKKKYQSQYGGGFITDAAYLAEYIMNRNFVKEGKTLPIKFWNDSRFKKDFQWQIIAANELLQELSCVQIMAFLRSRAGKNVLSLGQKKVILEGAGKLIPVSAEVYNTHINSENIIWDEVETIEEKKHNTSLGEKLQ